MTVNNKNCPGCMRHRYKNSIFSATGSWNFSVITVLTTWYLIYWRGEVGQHTIEEELEEKDLWCSLSYFCCGRSTCELSGRISAISLCFSSTIKSWLLWWIRPGELVFPLNIVPCPHFLWPQVLCTLTLRKNMGYGIKTGWKK